MDRVINLKKKRPDGAGQIASGNGGDKTRPQYQPDRIVWSGPLWAYPPNVRLAIVFSVLLLGVAAFFYLYRNEIITALFFLLASIFVLSNSHRKAPVTDFAVGPVSVHIGEREIKFSEIKSFWMEYNPGGIKELSIQLNKWYLPYIKIPFSDQDPARIHKIMIKFVPEKEHEDSAMDIFGRKLGL